MEEYIFYVTMDDTQEEEYAEYPGQFGHDILAITKEKDGTYSWYSNSYDDGETGFKTIENAKADYIQTMKDGEFDNIHIEEEL